MGRVLSLERSMHAYIQTTHTYKHTDTRTYIHGCMYMHAYTYIHRLL